VFALPVGVNLMFTLHRMGKPRRVKTSFATTSTLINSSHDTANTSTFGFTNSRSINVGQ
jgi:hypothetical protein